MKHSISQLAGRVAVLRIAFGVVWAIDAAFKWQPAFANTFLDQIKAAAEGQPAWLDPWFHTWNNLLQTDPRFFAMLVAVIESLIAIALIIGLAKRLTYLLAIVFSLLVWGVAEGFGGPYGSGSNDIGASVIYALVFFAFYGLEQLAGTSRYSVDNWLERQVSWWHVVARPGQR